MRNIFTEHPQSVNETYLQHLKFAGIFGIRLLLAGVVTILHAIFPFVFQTTGSTILVKLYRQIESRLPGSQSKHG